MNSGSCAYMGKILRVNLSLDSISTESTDTEVMQKYIGGRGLGVKIMCDEVNPKTDPLKKENKIIIAGGPLTGTFAPMGGRYAATTKSPLTNTILDSICGGRLGSEIKYAGYDALIIEGASKDPVYIKIDDSEVEIKSAEKYWGMDTIETEKAMLSEPENKGFDIACIGPAGERMIRYALVMNDERALGRGGVGAVFGSKNLKAILAKGSKAVSIADKKTFMDAIGRIRKTVNAAMAVKPGGVMNLFGTSSNVNFMNMSGVFPTRNFQEGYWKGAGAISGEKMVDSILKYRKGCMSCSIACGRLIKIEDGKHAGAYGEGPEYETVGLFGGSCGIDNIEGISKASLLCNEAGVDTISCADSIAFLMECYEKGFITKEQTDGLELNFGNEDAVLEIIRKIGTGEGIGTLASKGTKIMSEEIGQGSDFFAMHVKGMELPAYDPRGLMGQALGYATSNRGGCHLRAYTALPEASGAPVPTPHPDLPAMVDRFKTEDKPLFVKLYQDLMSTSNSALLCVFINLAPGIKDWASMIGAAAGFKFSEEDYMNVGDRIYTLERAFNAAVGFSRKDDTLPRRFLEEPMPEGGSKGRVVPLDEMLDKYYELRGLDGEGHPTKAKMTELGLDGYLHLMG